MTTTVESGEENSKQETEWESISKQKCAEIINPFKTGILLLVKEVQQDAERLYQHTELRASPYNTMMSIILDNAPRIFTLLSNYGADNLSDELTNKDCKSLCQTICHDIYKPLSTIWGACYVINDFYYRSGVRLLSIDKILDHMASTTQQLRNLVDGYVKP